MSTDSKDTANGLRLGLRPGITGVQALNAAAVIIAALYLGRELLVPMVLAVLVAFVLAPAVTLLQRARLGQTLSVLLAVALTFAAVGGIGVVVGNQAADLAAKLLQYQTTVQDKVRSLAAGGEIVERIAASVERLITGGVSRRAEVPVSEAPAAAVQGPSTIGVARTVLVPLLSPVATLGITIVFMIFVLLYRTDLRDRLVRLLGRQDLHRTILALNDAAARLSQFFLVQLGLNLGFGAYVTAGLWLAGLPNPVLWGILAGLMRFVPYIGSIIAVVPPLLLALAVSPGWGMAAVVLAVVLGGDLIMGQVIEPLTFGHSTGLSPIAVIVSTAFWAFLWGPVGLLIATPLSVCLVVVGRHVEGLAFLQVLLGGTSPLEPAETFYQRALEANQPELVRQAREDVARTSPVEYFDRVAMPDLVLAQADLSRDALAFDRMEAIHAEIAAMLAALDRSRSEVATAVVLPPGWRQEGAVRCIPGRGPLDDLAATMAVQALWSEGFGAQSMANAALGSAGAPGDDLVQLCCISALEAGSSAASIRFFVRRIQRRIPHAAVVVCLWQATGSSPTLATLRSQGGDEFIVLSLSELIALARVTAARSASAQRPEETDQRHTRGDDDQR